MFHAHTGRHYHVFAESDPVLREGRERERPMRLVDEESAGVGRGKLAGALIAKRVLEGTAASAHAAEAGSRAPLLAGLGWAQVEKILQRAA